MDIISLSQIPGAQIIYNYLYSNSGSMPGIFLSSCNGNLRNNSIIGHSIGLSLANSSPLVGANEIYGNLINGIYVGYGSIPDLRASLIGHPPNQYPVSGYNSIFENGGYTEEGSGSSNDDGSEIYFNNSNIQMESGCNLIADDRIPQHPLETTLLLMNGTTTNRISARYNCWGDTVYTARFGGLTVKYSPYYSEPCTFSGDIPLVMQDNDGNTLDTVYS
ncbi:MAG TPA: hypothetical protein VLB50_03290 [Ignavibacteriaceae bacterium]|nr:hypothetical protein [Ignavibacteriaceae bacterium]